MAGASQVINIIIISGSSSSSSVIIIKNKLQNKAATVNGQLVFTTAARLAASCTRQYFRNTSCTSTKSVSACEETGEAEGGQAGKGTGGQTGLRVAHITIFPRARNARLTTYPSYLTLSPPP